MDECEHDVPAGGYFSPKLYLQRYVFNGLVPMSFAERKISDMNLSKNNRRNKFKKCSGLGLWRGKLFKRGY